MPGRFVAPRLSELALPAGMRAVVDQAEARAMWERTPAVSGVLRDDARATRRAVWAALVDLLHDESGTVVASQVCIAERASAHAGRTVARSTAGNHLRALLDSGALYQSQTMRGASAAALGSDRGRAGAYVILTAAEGEQWSGQGQADLDALEARLDAQAAASVDELGHLPERSPRESDLEVTHPRMGGDFPCPTPRSEQRDVGADTSAQGVLGRSGGESWLTQRAQHPELYDPRTGGERQQAVLWLAAVMGWTGERRFEEELGKITRPFFDAGWSARAIVYALEHRPDGGAWPCSLPAPHQRDSANAPRPRSLWAVLTWRLTGWRGPTGTPAAPPVEVFKPRRGRPPGAVSRRRELAERYERLPSTDPRRAELHAALTGTPAPARPTRGAEAAAEVDITRAKLAALAARNAADRAGREARADALRAELASRPVVDVDQDVPEEPDDDQPTREAVVMARAILRSRVERPGRIVARVGRRAPEHR